MRRAKTQKPWWKYERGEENQRQTDKVIKGRERKRERRVYGPWDIFVCRPGNDICIQQWRGVIKPRRKSQRERLNDGRKKGMQLSEIPANCRAPLSFPESKVPFFHSCKKKFFLPLERIEKKLSFSSSSHLWIRIETSIDHWRWKNGNGEEEEKPLVVFSHSFTTRVLWWIGKVKLWQLSLSTIVTLFSTIVGRTVISPSPYEKKIARRMAARQRERNKKLVANQSEIDSRPMMNSCASYNVSIMNIINLILCWR